MAHNIDQTVTETGAMAYVGTEGKPWHGLGQPVEKGATPEQIAEAANLTWRVLKRKASFAINEKQFITDDQHFGLIRSDSLAVLDVCGPDYTPHQNIEVLEFFREYVEAGDMFIDTAGALNGGKQIWVLARMEKHFTLPGKDRVEGYVLLMNPHQYGKGMIAKFTAIRVVCNNTLTAALNAGGESVKIWHTAEFNAPRRQEVKEKLGIAKERLDSFKHDANELAKVTVGQDDVVELFASIMKQPAGRPLNQQNRAVTRLVQLFNGAGRGADLASAKGTLWGALNAVTQYVDHEYGRSVNSRLNNAWLGTGEVTKRRALTELLAASRAGGN